MKFYIKFKILILILLSIILFNCKDKAAPDSEDNRFAAPEQINDGWETASLSSVGMDETFYIDLLNLLNEETDHKIHSILIVKDGKLVFEQYFPGEKFELALYTGEMGFDRNDTHTLCSATKSFTSALIGIAIDKGFIQTVDQKVFDFFPEYSDIISETPEKGDMTLEHLLKMTSGMKYDDQTYSYYDSRNDMNRMYSSNEPIWFLLSRELETIPGAVFKYNNNNTNILGEVVYKATGQRLDFFCENYLFHDLGITNFKWQVLSAGEVLASGELRLCPRDMAKFGLLFLNGGIWENERIISQSWVEISTEIHISLDWGWETGYGYQWWILEFESNGQEFSAYAAMGWGNQLIIQIPELDLVVVTTAGNYYTDPVIPVKYILENFIIPSIL